MRGFAETRAFVSRLGNRSGVRLLACATFLALLASPAITSDPSASAALASPNLMMAPEHTAALASTLDENAAVIDYGSSAQDRNAAIPFLAEAPSALAGFSAASRNDPRFANAHRCLTQAIYYEAATEPVVGQRAVAQVVLNRVRHPAFPSTVCGVVYEGWDRPVCQFSFVCDGSLARQPIARLWERSQQLASDALTGHVETSVGSATHYHADYVLPRWAFTLGKIEQIGVHIFYRFPGRVGLPASFTANWRGREWIPPVRRTMLARNDEILPADDGSVAPINALEPDPTDRRAPNDVGGRLDTTTEWRLEIPMPGETSSSLDQARASHEAADEGSR